MKKYEDFDEYLKNLIKDNVEHNRMCAICHPKHANDGINYGTMTDEEIDEYLKNGSIAEAKYIKSELKHCCVCGKYVRPNCKWNFIDMGCCSKKCKQQRLSFIQEQGRL